MHIDSHLPWLHRFKSSRTSMCISVSGDGEDGDDAGVWRGTPTFPRLGIFPLICLPVKAKRQSCEGGDELKVDICVYFGS